MKFFILSIFGKDRPGIVAGVSEALYRLGLNIEDSSMTRLNGEFTIMLIVSSESNITSENILESLKDVKEKFHLFTLCKEVQKLDQKEHKPRELYRLVVFGSDKPGIVYSVSKLLAQMGINIYDLKTEKRGDLYVMIIQAESQEDVFEELSKKLDDIRESLRVDISLEREEEELL
ncbi:glycine cleavage system protein R [Hydrogenobacter thermophilus]|uniref:glycine cleavage system protein R n=1 Tax=Hydrogenobacter thermophilus TaxID=940 RepID=UPI0030F8D56C